MWGGKGFLHSQFYVTVHYQKQRGQELNPAGQEPGGRSGCKGAISLAAPNGLLIEPWTTHPGVASPRMLGSPQSLIRKVTQALRPVAEVTNNSGARSMNRNCALLEKIL